MKHTAKLKWLAFSVPVFLAGEVIGPVLALGAAAVVVAVLVFWR